MIVMMTKNIYEFMKLGLLDSISCAQLLYLALTSNNHKKTCMNFFRPVLTDKN